jgi:hypothetical protein
MAHRNMTLTKINTHLINQTSDHSKEVVSDQHLLYKIVYQIMQYLLLKKQYLYMAATDCLADRNM